MCCKNVMKSHHCKVDSVDAVLLPVNATGKVGTSKCMFVALCKRAFCDGKLLKVQLTNCGSNRKRHSSDWVSDPQSQPLNPSLSLSPPLTHTQTSPVAPPSFLSLSLTHTHKLRYPSSQPRNSPRPSPNQSIHHLLAFSTHHHHP